MKVDNHVKGAIRQFAFWFAHGTVGGEDFMKGVDYLDLLKEESSFAEMAFVIFLNNLEYNEEGVTNYKKAEFRAAQYIKQYCDPSYIVQPGFEDWETEAYPVSGKHYSI